MGTSLLSPVAEPFQPTGAGMEFAIFNNGVPSSVFYGIPPEHDVVQHITDEAIDETFPPTAEDIAEMEAAEEFVEFMAWLSFLDECDEQARFSFVDIKKRWEARRIQGLIGKPHPRKNSFDQAQAEAHIKMNSQEKSLVPFVPRFYEDRPVNFGKGNKAMGRRMMYGGSKKVKGVHGYGAAIQQPRKHN